MFKLPDDLLVTLLYSPVATPRPVPLSWAAVPPPAVPVGAVVPAVVPPVVAPVVLPDDFLSSPHAAATMARPAAAPPIWIRARRDSFSRKLCGARILIGSCWDGIRAPWDGTAVSRSRWLLLMRARRAPGFPVPPRIDTRLWRTIGTTPDHRDAGSVPSGGAARRSRRAPVSGRRIAGCRRSGTRRPPH